MRHISFRETRIIRAISTGARFIASEGREKRGRSSIFIALMLAIHNFLSIVFATRVVVGVGGGAALDSASFVAASLRALIVAGRAWGLITRRAAATSAASGVFAAGLCAAATTILATTVLRFVGGLVLVIKAEQEGHMFRVVLELEQAIVGVGDVVGGGRREICLVSRLAGVSSWCLSHVCDGEVKGIPGVVKGKLLAIMALGD